MITTDEKLIRSILEDESVIGGFSNGEKLTSEQIDGGIFHYFPDVGLFPCQKSNNIVSIHAAIPKACRGRKAVETARYLVKGLVAEGNIVISTIISTDRHVRLFASLVGFELVSEYGDYMIYRY